MPASGQLRRVENEDIAQRAGRIRHRACSGTFEISRVATGYKCGLAVRSLRHARQLAFDQERMNELRLYSATIPPAGAASARS